MPQTAIAPIHNPEFLRVIEQDIRTISDEQVEALGKRFESSNVFMLMGITFEEYMDAPESFDRIAAHLNAGGGCKVINGKLVVIGAPGECTDCGQWITARSGGLNQHHQCGSCAEKFPIVEVRHG